MNREDHLDIRSDLEEKSLTASKRYERLFTEATATLKELPHAGRDRPDLPRSGVRS